MTNIIKENSVKLVKVPDTNRVEVIQNIWSDGATTYTVLGPDGDAVCDEDLDHLPSDDKVRKLVEEAQTAFHMGIAEAHLNVTTNYDEAGLQRHYDKGRGIGFALLGRFGALYEE